MKIVYLKKINNYDDVICKKNINNNLKKIICDIKIFFNILTVKQIDTKFLIILPFKDNVNNKKIDKIIKKINNKTVKIFKENSKVSVVLSKDIEKNEYLTQKLIQNNLNILNGRWLFNLLIMNILQYIANIQNKKIEELDVSVLVENNSEINLYNIELLANAVKSLNIVTNNIKKFKYLEDILYEEKGIAISVSNNKRKSLLKSNIIVNMDVSEENLNKFNVKRDAILINLKEKINIKSKSFNGVNINDFEIKLPKMYTNIIFEYNEFTEFWNKQIYESYIYKIDKIQNLMKQVERDKIQVNYLIGNNGILDEREFLKNY